MELKPPAAIFPDAPKLLLIVPYGIETLKELHYQKGQRAFNRTLWN